MRTVVGRSWTGILVLAVLVAVWSTGCPQPAQTATLRLLNVTGKTIDAVYCVPSGSGAWGGNHLTASLPTGYYMDITGFSPGAYDILAVFSDGSDIDWRTDLEAGETYTWNVYLSCPSG